MQVMGDVALVLESNSHLELKNNLYVPESRKNLILVSNLNKYNYAIYFNKSVFIRKNDSFILLGLLVDNLLRITPISILLCVENYHISLKRKMPSTNQRYLWHICLSHINLNRIQRLVESTALHSSIL